MKPRDYIQQFCAQAEDIRSFLTTPARHDGKLYASTGHILICTDDDPDVVATDDITLINRAKPIALQMPGSDESFKPLVVDLPAPEPCMYCGGSGKVKKCPSCKGEGEIETSKGFVCECSTCHGNGDIQGDGDEVCWLCDGTKYLATQPVSVGNTFFARRYLELVQTLPNLVFSVSPIPTSVSFFRFDGGWGALMPCRGD